MSAAGRDLVARALDAVNRGDAEAYLELCTDDVELVSAFAAFEGSHRGPDGIRSFFADLAQVADEYRFEVERFEEAGDRVLVHARVTARGRGSGVPAETRIANLYDLRDGRIARVQAFLDAGEARRAAGLG